MTFSRSSKGSAPPSKLSKLLDWAIYGSVALVFGMLLMRGKSGPAEGTRAKAFELPLASGDGSFRLEEAQGKPVLLEVFASWCGACKRAAPMVDRAYRQAQKNGYVFVGVSVDDNADAARQARANWPIDYPVVVDDGQVQRGYAVSLLPTFVLIDKSGTIKHVSAGVPSERTLQSWLSEP